MARIYQLQVTIVTADNDILDYVEAKGVYSNAVDEWLSNVMDEAAQEVWWIQEFAVNECVLDEEG